MLDVPLVDSHVHLWDLDKLSYPWLIEFPKIHRNFLPQDLSNESAPFTINKIVFIECGGQKIGNITENEFVTQLAKKDSRIKAIIAHAPLENRSKVEKILIEFKKNALIRGVRRLIQSEKDLSFCLTPEFIEGIKLLPRFGYTFDLCVYHHQLPSVIKLVRLCPEVKFVLNHLGKPSVRTNTLDPWNRNLKELSIEPNVFCKLSGLATEADWTNWNTDQLKPYIEHAIDCFGYHRLMFGGDWPVSKLAVTYTQWASIIKSLTQSASLDERISLFSKTAELFYRI
jgi:L-fuconolactonase